MDEEGDTGALSPHLMLVDFNGLDLFGYTEICGEIKPPRLLVSHKPETPPPLPPPLLSHFFVFFFFLIFLDKVYT